MVLMVFFSSRISPRTSTVIFLERSPVATAVVTSAMLRTWAVRLLAIRLTLSVRSFHVPATPRTWAWPPSFPSVPTSRATRVTSAVKAPSCSTMALTVLAVLRTSPCRGRPSTSSAMACERSPLATAPITRAISFVGRTRSLTSELTDSIMPDQSPLLLPSEARWVSLPSLPTTLLTRSSSLAVFCVELKDVVERIGDFPVDPGPFNRQANGKVAILDRHQGTQEQLGIQVTIGGLLHCCGLLVGLLGRHSRSPSFSLKWLMSCSLEVRHRGLWGIGHRIALHRSG